MRSPRTWACTPWPRRSAGRSWTGEAWRCRRAGLSSDAAGLSSAAAGLSSAGTGNELLVGRVASPPLRGRDHASDKKFVISGKPLPARRGRGTSAWGLLPGDFCPDSPVWGFLPRGPDYLSPAFPRLPWEAATTPATRSSSSLGSLSRHAEAGGLLPGDFCLGTSVRKVLSGDSCPGSPPHGAVLVRRLTVLSPTHE